MLLEAVSLRAGFILKTLVCEALHGCCSIYMPFAKYMDSTLSHFENGCNVTAYLQD